MQQTNGKIRILFIGNSYTAGNFWPNLFESVSNSHALESKASEPEVEVKMVLTGAATLQTHWLNGTAELIREQPWDYVVLQENALLGGQYFEGETLLNTDVLFHLYARLFDQVIKEVGAKMVFLLPWAAKDKPGDQAILNRTHSKIARELDAAIIPAGYAWEQVGQVLDPSRTLYGDDGYHASALGNMLLVCITYAFFNPKGLALKDDKVIATLKALVARASSASVPDSLITEIGECCHRCLGEFDELRRGLAIDAKSAPYNLPPVLPRGEHFSMSDLKGKWAGAVKLYEQSATLALHIQENSQGFYAELTLTQEGGATISLPHVDIFHQTGDEQSIENRIQNLKYAAGQQGDEAKELLMFGLDITFDMYQGVYLDGSLVGTIKSSLGTYPETSRMGTWQLDRVCA